MQASIMIRVTADLTTADKFKCRSLVENLLLSLKNQGEDWQREVQANDDFQKFLKVETEFFSDDAPYDAP